MMKVVIMHWNFEKELCYFNEQDKRLAQNDFLSAWMPLKYWYFYDSDKK